MNDTPVQLGAKFIRSGFGLFIFGLVMSFGVVGHYMVGSRWDTGTEFLKNITLWYACPWTLSTAVVLIGAVGMIAIGAGIRHTPRSAVPHRERRSAAGSASRARCASGP